MLHNESFFHNEPLTDFTVQKEVTALRSELEKLETRRSRQELYAAPIIGGKELTGEAVRREDPGKQGVILGTARYATTSQGEEAIQLLKSSQRQWAHTPMKIRADCLLRAANIMRERKHELSALIIREAGKPWKEADADVAEAIDFCTYYALHSERYAQPVKTAHFQGEENWLLYQPRGVSVVISPWNFPLAIACGMTVASLVAGNATILKPAEQTSLIAFEFAKILLDAGIPPNVFAFLPGVGEVIGKHLVEHPETHLIAFTGSRPVGLQILKSAAELAPNQRHIKRTILELGGKNAIIVDEDADSDEAIKGILYSAFGFAGQKCSACSRAIVVGSRYSSFVQRLAEAAQDLLVGDAEDAAVFLGPVIDEEAYTRITRTIEEGRKNLTLLTEGRAPKGGFYIAPTIFMDVPTENPLWKEEIFGPVLCVTPAKDFATALEMANDSAYALTGGVYSRHPRHLEEAKKFFEAGNLYINRGCTGAIVGRHPFGGFKLSGIGSKAGGPDYLLQFMEPRVISENTIRKGFVPEE